MHSNMNADEVVKGLQYLSGVLRAQAWHKARERNKELATTCSEAADLIESLQKQLAEAQRRADAAVADLDMACASGAVCEACKHFDSNVGDGFPCRESGKWCGGRIWQWRGPQE